MGDSVGRALLAGKIMLAGKALLAGSLRQVLIERIVQSIQHQADAVAEFQAS